MRISPYLLALALLPVLVGGACTLTGKKKAADAGASPKPAPGEDRRDSPDGLGTPPGTASPPPPPVSSPLMPPQDESKLNTAGDVVDYAKLCKAELGMPEAILPPWNCVEGTEIPITVGGKPLDAATYKTLARTGNGCDKPSWLGDVPCSNYAFVQRREITADVSAVLLCRMRGFSNEKGVAARRADYEKDQQFTAFRALYDFDSLGLIWTNKKTGKTCFFDYVGKVFGGYVPSPDDDRVPAYDAMPEPKPPKTLPAGVTEEVVWKKTARTTWKAPKEVAEKDNCVRCHDTGPFKSSPYMDQALKFEPNNMAVPFLIVGKVMERWRQQFPLYAISTTKVQASAGEADQLCTSCHRIGSQASCDEEIAFAVGESAPATLSAHGAGFFNRMWMPPLPAELVTSWSGKNERQLKAAWTGLYAAHVQKLRCCCQTPNARGCTHQDITVNPLPAPVVGTGPGECR